MVQGTLKELFFKSENKKKSDDDQFDMLARDYKEKDRKETLDNHRRKHTVFSIDGKEYTSASINENMAMKFAI